LKTHYNGANRLYIPDDAELGTLGFEVNHVPVSQGTMLDQATGNVDVSGEKSYTLTYTRPTNYDANSEDYTIHTFFV